MTGFVFQPKPEGDHYVEIHLCYKRITDDKVTTAALLSVLEYLAETSLESSSWTPGDKIPDEIRINEDCNFPRLHRLLDGMMGITAIRDKLKFLDRKGFIRIDYSESARRRCVFYNYKKVSETLQKVDLTPQKVNGHSPKNGGSAPQKMEGQKVTPQKVLGDPSKSVGLTPQKVDPSNTLSNPSSNPTLSLSDRTNEERECDASLQPAQPATQSEETHLPVQKKEQNPEQTGSASQGSDQAETVDQLQEGESSAAPPLETLKIQLNRMKDDQIHPVYRQEWRMSGAIPWRDPRTGDIPERFAISVGKKLMFRGDRETMSALEKGRAHVLACEHTVDGMRKLIDYWGELSKKASPLNAYRSSNAPDWDTQKASPPPIDFMKRAKTAIFRGRYGSKSA